MAALPHPDRGRLADRPAAGQQHRPDRGRGAGRRAGRDQLAAHQRAGRGARPARRGGGRDRAAHPAGDHGGDRRANVSDPLGGSWFVEALTDRMEAEAEAIFARIREMSSDGSMADGILQGIENGWFIGEIAEASFVYQQQLEKGEKRIVGVNCHTNTVAQPLEILRISPEVEREQVSALARRRAGRDQQAVDAALAALVAAAPHRGEPGAADAGRGPRRGHPRRDLRCPPHRMGRLHRTRRLLDPVTNPAALRRCYPPRRLRRRVRRHSRPPVPPPQPRPVSTVHGSQHRPRSAPSTEVSTVHGQHRPRRSAPSTEAPSTAVSTVHAAPTVHGQHRPRSAPAVSTVHGQHRPRSAPAVSTVHGQHRPRSAPAVSTVHGQHRPRKSAEPQPFSHCPR